MVFIELCTTHGPRHPLGGLGTYLLQLQEDYCIKCLPLFQKCALDIHCLSALTETEENEAQRG